MCGRFTLTAGPEEVRAALGLDAIEDFPPRENIAPTEPIAIVRNENGIRRLALVRWGFVPSWVKDPGAFTLLFNARSETAAEKASFRSALRYRRCLVPASGFYEWQRGPGKGKQPYLVRPREGGVVAYAGIYELWAGADGSEIETACILTTAANDTLAAIHDRMPVVIHPEDFERWLDVRNSPNAIADLLRPAPEDFFELVPVDVRINSTRKKSPEANPKRPKPDQPSLF